MITEWQKKKKRRGGKPFPLLHFAKCFLSSASLNPCPMCWICSSHCLSVHGLFSLPVNVGYPVMHAWCMYFISINSPGLRFHWHLVASCHSSEETKSSWLTRARCVSTGIRSTTVTLTDSYVSHNCGHSMHGVPKACKTKLHHSLWDRTVLHLSPHMPTHISLRHTWSSG